MTSRHSAGSRPWNESSRRLLWIVGLVAVLVAAAAACGRPPSTAAAKSAPAASRPMYQCPMHPEVVSDKPGDCPICGMRLVPIAGSAAGSSPGPSPGPTGAALVGDAHAGHGEPPTAERAGSAPLGAVDIGADAARLAGVQTAVAVKGRVTRTVKATGTVAIDETRVRQVTTKVAGFVERLYVNATGQMVRAGQPLFDLFSPELLATQEEYLRARVSAAQFANSSLPEVRKGGADLVAAARRRLELFDVPADFLERLDQTGLAQRTITFRSPFAGFVTGKSVVSGQRIEPGMDLLTVTDLSRVWVMAQLYEAEARAAQPGRTATVTLPYEGRPALRGRIGFVYPTLDADTRTLRVRIEFDNPGGALKPGMYVDVDLGVEASDGIVVPDGAVLDSGTRQVVFVEEQAGRFVPRDVSVGVRADGQALIRAGLAGGERVVVAANFLLDSESRLRNAARATRRQEH